MRKTRKSCFAVGLWLMALGFFSFIAVAETATPPAQPAAVQQAKAESDVSPAPQMSTGPSTRTAGVTTAGPGPAGQNRLPSSILDPQFSQNILIPPLYL